jgi:VCBS repeat-containing protein
VQHGFEATLNEISASIGTPKTLTNLSVSDDSATGEIQVTLSVKHGELNLEDASGVTVNGAGTGLLTLTGTVSAINAALASGVDYTSNLTAKGADALTIVANDEGHNSSGTALSTSQQIAIVVDEPTDEIWTAGVDGDWNDGGNWSLSRAPVASDKVYINDPVTVSDDLSDDDDQSIAELHVMSSGAELDIISSSDPHSFTITGALQNVGEIAVDTFDSGGADISATISGSVQNSGTIWSDGSGASLTFGGVTVDNTGGTLASFDGADLFFSGTTVTLGQIQSDDSSTVHFHGATLQSVELFDVSEDLGAGFLVEGSGPGAITVFTGTDLDHFVIDENTQVNVEPGATLQLEGSIDNNGVILADGSGSEVDIEADIVGGTLSAYGGSFKVTGDSTFDGANGSPFTIADETGVSVEQDVTLHLTGEIDNSGTITLRDGTSVSIEGDVTLDGGGSIHLDGTGNQIVEGDTDLSLELISQTIVGTGTIGDGNLTLLSDAPGNGNGGGIIEVFGGTLSIDAGEFNNQGLLIAEGGGTLEVKNAIDNLGDDGNLVGGSYDVTDGDPRSGGSSIVFDTGPAITTLNAAVQLDGPTATIISGGLDLQHSLQAVGAAGSLYLAGGDAGAPTNFLDTATSGLDVAGVVTINGGTLSAHGLTIENGVTDGNGGNSGIIKGSGVISADGNSIDNGGLILAQDGKLEINAAITGTGTLEIAGANGTLQIDATHAAPANANLQAVSIGDQSILFSNDGADEKLVIGGGEVDSTTDLATISGFAAGDSIDLTGIIANGYSFDGTNLILKENGTVVGSLALSGLSAGTQFNVSSDNGTGTLITEAGALQINQGPQTASVSDGGAWYATGQLTVSDPANSPVTWSIVGGSKYSTGTFNFGIQEFSVTKTDGSTSTTVFDDSFNGTVPPAGPSILVGSSPSGTSYNDFNSGIYVQGTGEALIQSSHDGYLGIALGAGPNYGAPVFGQFTTLLTATSYNTNDPTDGLRSGQSFTVSGLFDLTTPADTTSRYGIRLSDRVAAATDPADNQPGTEVVDIGVVKNGNGTASIVFSELNYETGVSDNLQSLAITGIHAGDSIRLSLSNDAANNGAVVASYQLVKSDGTPDGGIVTLGAVGHIFDNEDWTLAQFYSFDVSTATSSSPQADSILQGTYGQLDLAQDGTWHYSLNPGLASVKALADGVHASDDFTVQVTDASGAVSTQTISVDVTGKNDAPVATASAQYTITSGTPLSLVNTGLSVSDPDDGGKTETVTLSVDEGTISLNVGDSGVSAASVTGSGTGSVTFSGTIAQINALLNTSSGTIVYTDNSASPGFFNAATLKLTIDDNGSNGGSALSDTASATINVAPPGGTLEWNREIDPFAAASATNISGTKWIMPNSDGLTSTVFVAANGSSFTYDATTHLPTVGVVGKIELVDNTTGNDSSGHVLQTITNLNGVQIGDFGNFIAREQAIQKEIPWAGLIETHDTKPVSFTSADIRLANSDGTFTEIIGSNFAQSGDSHLTGTVTAVEHIGTDGTSILETVNFSGGTSLGDLASAIFPDNVSREFYALMTNGNTTVTGNPVSVASGAVTYFLDGGVAATGTHHTLTGPAGSTFVFQEGYGALTITNFDQAGGPFNASQNDIIQLNNLGAPQNVTFVQNGNGTDTVIDFGNNDVLTLHNVTQAQYNALNGSEFAFGNNNGGNNGGPVISNAGNTVTYAGSPVFVDQSIAVADSTGTVTSVNVWISSGYQSGDTLSIGGAPNVSGTPTDGTITDSDGSIISYHFDPNANNNNNGIPAGGIFLQSTGATPATTADFQAAIELIQFTGGAGSGDRIVTWAAEDNHNQFSSTVTTTVHVADNVALVGQNSFGGSGEHQAAAVTFANGHLYLSYNNGPENQDTSDNATIVAFNTGGGGATQTFSYAWSKGDLFGIAADGSQIYAAGESTPNFGLTQDGSGGTETKSILVRFAADGTSGNNPSPAEGYGATNFFSYRGVESFNNVLATTQNGNTVLYAVGFGQPASFSGYVIGEYDSSGHLLASASDSLASFSNPGGSSASAAVDWNGAIWVVGSSQHPNLGDTYGHATVWTASYDLSSVVMHEDNTGGVSASFNGVATIGNALYAVGSESNNNGDYLIAKYNPDGSVTWSQSFGGSGADTLNAAVSLNGHLYAVGSTVVGSVTEGVLMEIDPSNGTVISTTVYDPAQYNSFTSITTDGHHLYVAGVSGSSSSQDKAVLVTYDPASVAIPDGGNLTVDGPSSETVVFASGSGTLHLDQPSTFTGVIAGISGNGDVLDIHGFHYGTTTATTAGGFDFATDTTTLTVHDTNGNLTETFKLVGDYSASTWNAISDDGHGGVNIVDPPASNSDPLGAVIMHDPGQAADDVTIGHDGSSELAADSVASVTFSDASGNLILDDASSSQISVNGFTGDGTLAGSDQIDLKGLDFNSQTFAENYDATKDVLTVTDGNQTATLQFNGNYQAANFNFVSDGHGGTIVYDPPVPTSAAQGHDGFAFDFPAPVQGVLQDIIHEVSDALAPLKDVLHLTGDTNLRSILLDGHGTAPAGGTPPQTSIFVDPLAWQDSLKLLPQHADLHV